MTNTRTVVAKALLVVGTILLLTGCASSTSPMDKGTPESGGTAWGVGAFHSNGERIYFTATSERNTAITYTGGPASGGGMMTSGQLTCASCHGPTGQGGQHNMGMMRVMNAPDIRWSVLTSDYDPGKFRRAIVEGIDPDGKQMATDMPRWNISNDDLADLIAYLKTLP